MVKVIEGEAPMFEKLQIVRMAQALAGHAGARQGEIARNIANADTPGYRARDMPDFAAAYADGGGCGSRGPGIWKAVPPIGARPKSA
ncbi:hypothetical protein ACFSHQ_05285 [Gemmobacter lanyuensis]